MKISELSKATGVAPRMLRYYEEQGLIAPTRDDNGYRRYCGDAAVDRVAQIRGLLGAGVPTSIIRDLIPCLRADRDILVEDLDPDMRARLAAEAERLDARIRCLTRNRDAIHAYVACSDARSAT